MGASWTAVRDSARLHTLRKADPGVAAVASRWDELVQYLVLHLTRELGRDVRQLLKRQENTSATRHQALKDSLVAKGQLYAELQIPNTAGPLEILADLTRARSRSPPSSTLPRKAGHVGESGGCFASSRPRHQMSPSRRRSRRRRRRWPASSARCARTRRHCSRTRPARSGAFVSARRVILGSIAWRAAARSSTASSMLRLPTTETFFRT